MAEGILMDELKAPFFGREGNDVFTSDSISQMEAEVEAIDVPGYEFFDAVGHRLVANVEGQRVHLVSEPDVAADPSRLEEILRSYFAELPRRFRKYSEYAKQASTLDELVSLRRDLAADSRSSRFFRDNR